jgi:hypothetical protein
MWRVAHEYILIRDNNFRQSSEGILLQELLQFNEAPAILNAISGRQARGHQADVLC